MRDACAHHGLGEGLRVGQRGRQRLLAEHGDTGRGGGLGEGAVEGRRGADPHGIDRGQDLGGVGGGDGGTVGARERDGPVEVGVTRGDHRGVDEPGIDDSLQGTRVQRGDEPATDNADAHCHSRVRVILVSGSSLLRPPLLVAPALHP